MRKSETFSLLIIITHLLFSCDFSVNESYHLRDGEKRNKGLNTVNGTIDIGKNCLVRGTCRTVNGKISVGRNSIIKEIQTVNGQIEIGENVSIRRDIKAVTSEIDCARGSNISGGIFTINAQIRLRGCRVKEDIEVIAGKIELLRGSEIHGSIIGGKSGSHYEFDTPPKLDIYISSGSVIDGDIDIRQDKLKAQVFIAPGGRVLGEIHGAQVIRE